MALRSLVDSLLDGFPTDTADEPILDAVRWELAAGDMLGAIFADDGPHLPAMVQDVAQELAGRAAAKPDRALAALAHASTGPAAPGPAASAFLRAWQQRRQAATDPIALAIGADRAVRAFEITHEAGDGANVIMAISNPLGAYSVGVYIDHNLGGIAKDVLIGPSVDRVEATFDASQGFRHRTISLGEAAWRFDEALERTYRTIDAPISEDFEDLLPSVALRFALVEPRRPATLVDPDGHPFGHVEVSRAERIAHLGAFKTSAEFEAIPQSLADDALEVVRLWIDHAVDYTVGAVRRVSPVLVEIFCSSWFPRKVVADEEMVTAAPVGIAAWLQFCARTTGISETTLDAALDALAEFGQDLGRALDDPSSWGLAKGLLGGAGSPLDHLLQGEGFGEVTELIQQLGTLPDDENMASWLMPDDITWRPLRITEEGERVHLEVDPSDVPPWQYVKTKMIASQASVQAASLLGSSFAQPAAELAVAIGSAEPCLYDNSQIRSWPGAIVWVLAEDSGAFAPREVGRRRDDLADALPMTRATYQAKAKKIREVLQLEKGDLRVDW